MIIEDLLDKRKMTKHKLAVAAGVPQAALDDIYSGKTKLEKCSAETVYKIANALGVSMEMLTESGLRETKRERSYECGLPDYLQHDLDAYKEGLKTKSDILDCLWGGSCMAASTWRKSARAQLPRNMRTTCGRNIFGIGRIQ